MGYYSSSRNDMLKFISVPPCKVLEFGCGEGNFGALLKETYGCSVTGMDICSDAVEKAKMKLDQAFLTNIEEFDFSLLAKDYDLIVANDVLEHLSDPWTVIKIVKNNLISGGYFIASIPNVRYRHVVLNLLFKGEWNYTSEGILDKTHLRFFTKASIPGLFEGFQVQVEPVNVDHIPRKRILEYLHKKITPDMFTVQYAVVAKKR